MDKIKLSPANIVILIGGVVILLGSFLDFQKAKSASFQSPGGSSAWSTGLFLIATIPVLIGVVMAAHVALVAFAPQVKLPEKVLGLNWNQVHLVLGFQATIMMLAFLVHSTPGSDKAIGLYLMLLAAIALFVGAVLRMQETAKPAR
jgi:hypothetical protein